jgi:hypothetical protein
MKSRKLLLLSLSSLLLLTSCSLFNDWKNGEGTFSEDLIKTSFEKEPTILSTGKTLNVYKVIDSNTMKKQTDDYVDETYSKSSNGLEVRYQKVEKEQTTATAYVYRYTKTQNSDETYSYKKEKYSGTSVIESEVINREVYDEIFDMTNVHYAELKALYFNNFMVDYNYYLTDVKNKTSDYSYTFRYFQKSAIWYIQMKISKNGNETKRYTFVYSTFPVADDKGKITYYPYISYFSYGTFSTKDNDTYYSTTAYNASIE